MNTENTYKTDSGYFVQGENLVITTLNYVPETTVKIVSTKHPVPSKATTGAAGYDLRACLDTPTTIYPGTTMRVRTGLYMDIPDGVFGLVVPRSGLATKHGVTLANSVGIIDSDFTGEILIAVRNEGDSPFIIEDGMRIAQLLFLTHLSPDMVSVKELNKTTDRNNAGFGTTGTN